VTTATLTERPRRLFADPPPELGQADVRHLPRRSDGGRSTLERKLESVWEDLHAAGAAECPVCEGPMERTAGSAVARCGGCGSALA